MATTTELLNGIIASKQAIINALKAKGVTVPNGAKLEDLAALVGNIEGGGGGVSLELYETDRDAMTELVIPEGVTRIGNHAFHYCPSLTSLVIPNGVTTIGEYAFGNCSALASFVIPDSVTSIEARAFDNCYKLTDLVIPNSVTTIGNFAFAYCSDLSSLVIPNSVTSIGDRAFFGCPSACNITFNKSGPAIFGMANYPWGIPSGAVIHCTTGDITVA